MNTEELTDIQDEELRGKIGTRIGEMVREIQEMAGDADWGEYLIFRTIGLVLIQHYGAKHIRETYLPEIMEDK